MVKDEKRLDSGFEPEKSREAEGSPAGRARFAIRRPAPALLLLAGAAGAWLLTSCTAHKPNQRPGAHRPPGVTAELPPEPTTPPPVQRWEKGPWWGDKPGERTSVSITNAGTQTIILGRSVSANPRYLTVRDLSLAAPPSEPLTLVLLKTGVEHPLHVLSSCSIQPNTAIRIDDSALLVDGALRVSGQLDLRRGHVATRTALLVGGSDAAPAEVHVRRGTLTVTNANHDARLIIGLSGRGDFYLDGGTIEADFLQVTNSPNNRFIFNSGTLKVSHLMVTNHGPIVIGDGVNPAALVLSSGTNMISSLLTVSKHALLVAEGNVTITGPVANYGTIVAGQPGAHLTFASAPPLYPSAVTNWGNMYMTNGGLLTFQGTVSNNVSAPITGVPTKQPGAGWTVRFISVGGLTHTLEYKDSLSDPNWTSLTNTTGTGEILPLTDPSPSDKARYYHIRVTQP
jgi:hypothetical protein